MAEVTSLRDFVLDTLKPLADELSPYDKNDYVDTEEIYSMILDKTPMILDIFKMLEGENLDLRSFVWGLSLGCCFGIYAEGTRWLCIMDDLINDVSDNVNYIFDDENDVEE